MKKIIITAFIVTFLAGCSKERTLSAPETLAIGFDRVFVENATKSATDLIKDNLNDFGVYGSIENTSGLGMLFNNVKVSKTLTGTYTYSPAQYWVGGATYNFTAFAPYDNQHWSFATTDAKNGTITFDNEAAAGEQDFLFAAASRTTVENLNSKPDDVSFSFGHMLSRVKFTFTNGFATGSNIALKVTDVKITNAHKSGTLAVSNGVEADTWTVQDNKTSGNGFTRAFGNAGNEKLMENASGTTEHYYLIPATANYNIEFKVEIFQAGISVDNYFHSINVDLDLEKGCSYNVKGTLNQDNTSDDGALHPIEFTVSAVNGWADWTPATL
jgi:hypothetical protein